jgi:hypothetical protein
MTRTFIFFGNFFRNPLTAIINFFGCAPRGVCLHRVAQPAGRLRPGGMDSTVVPHFPAVTTSRGVAGLGGSAVVFSIIRTLRHDLSNYDLETVSGPPDFPLRLHSSCCCGRSILSYCFRLEFQIHLAIVGIVIIHLLGLTPAGYLAAPDNGP